MTEISRDDEHATAAAVVGGEDGERPAEDPGQGVIRAFGRQLKLLRTRAGISRDELGRHVGYSASSIESFELGRRIPPPRFIDQADEFVDAGGILTAMKDEVARAQYPPFFRDAARLEREAVELGLYALQALPGLLQTEDYTRALLTIRRPLLDEETIEQRVASRAARKEIFSRWPAPLVSFVVDEAVLRRPFGGKRVLRGTWEEMLVLGQKRNVEIQIMPIDREDNAAVDGPFTVITRKDASQIGYLEVQGRSTLLTRPEDVRSLAARYAIIRSQALDPRESLAYIEKLLGEA